MKHKIINDEWLIFTGLQVVTIVVLIYIYTQVFTMAIYVILSPFSMVIEKEFDKQLIFMWKSFQKVPLTLAKQNLDPSHT